MIAAKINRSNFQEDDKKFLTFSTIWNFSEKSLTDDPKVSKLYIDYLLSKYGGAEGLTKAVIPHIGYQVYTHPNITC